MMSFPLSGAQIAMCRLVHHGPRPQATLRPVNQELRLYVEKTRTKPKRRMEASCLELALEGERLCKAGDFKGGTAFFEAAVQVGTEDLKTLSAIYSQLGNAYFYLKEYGKALEYHRHDLTLARTIGDRIGEGKASGNLGNTLKVLGRYDEAAVCCQRHLDISQEQGDKELGDRAAQGRAFGNLGNTHYLLGNFVEAIKFHRELKDQVMEAQACFSLGNTYTLLQEYERAIEYHLKHLLIAQELNDRVGEGRACWSLGNAYVSLGKHRQALHHARKHLEISREIGDRNGELTARMNVEELMEALGVKEADLSPSESEFKVQGARPKFIKKASMDSVDLWKYSSEKKLAHDASDEDCFFDLLSKFQSSRMDDQRCQLDEPPNGENAEGADPNTLNDMIDASLLTSPQTEELFDLIASSQSRRLDDQRVNVSNLPGLRITHNNLGHLVGESDPQEPSDDFFNMLIKCQSSRIDDQRCSPPEGGPRAPTVPDEDFFSLIQRVQAKRMDEQRVHLPSDEQESDEDEREPGAADS
ncbi:hypothetical protein cypCar_00027049 [Cyprinus carpio]|nr:hypothetical protein cypCar_00027049 [Cyprinus carpio]